MFKLMLIAIKLALSGALIFYAFSKIDGDSALRELHKLPIEAIVLTLLLLAIQYGLAAWRLRNLLHKEGAHSSIGVALDAVVIGAFFSQTLISFVGGDAMRVWRVTRQNVAIGNATRAVLLDRLLGFVGLIALITFGLPVLFHIVSDARVHTAIIILIGAAIIGCLLLAYFSRLPTWMRRHRLLTFVSKLSETSRAILSDTRSLWTLLAISLGIQIINVGVIYVSAVGLGVNLSALHCLVLVPPVLFLSMMPISFAGWGVRESAMVAALATVDVPPPQSLALSISYGLALVVVSLPGALLWFRSRTKAKSMLRCDQNTRRPY